jgi:hypothetical protein
VLPGLLAILCCLPVLVAVLLRSGAGSAFAGFDANSFSRQYADSLRQSLTAGEMTLSWIAVAALLSITAIAASFRLTGRSE